MEVLAGRSDGPDEEDDKAVSFSFLGMVGCFVSTGEGVMNIAVAKAFSSAAASFVVTAGSVVGGGNIIV